MDIIDTQNHKIMIEGMTNLGSTFRPSDWAERVCGAMSTFKNHRIHYSPLLYPSQNEGRSCIILDPKLASEVPTLYEYILEFANKNDLRIQGL